MRSFFDEENRMTKISKIGDPLEVLNAIIKWEMFRDILKKNIVRKENNKGGRPPFDMVMMFKILVLERLYNLSDDQAEFQINDRRSFMRFLGLESYDTVPDAKRFGNSEMIFQRPMQLRNAFICSTKCLQKKD